MGLALVTILVFLVSQSKQVKVPITPDIDIKIQLDQKTDLEVFPGLTLPQLRVKQISSDQTYKYSNLCRVNPLSLQTHLNSAVRFQQDNANSTNIIYEFEQLKSLKSAMDLTNFKEIYYVVFKQGIVQTYTRNNSRLHKGQVINYNKGLQQGEFTNDGEVLLYISQAQALQVQQAKLLEVKGYEPNSKFMFPKLYPNGMLFIALDRDGVDYYTFNPQNASLSNRIYLDLTAIVNQSVMVTDIAYDSDQSLLMVLDLQRGVHFFDFINGSIHKNSRYEVKMQGCQNMVYMARTIYLTCPNVVRYSLDTMETKTKQVTMYPEDLIVTHKKQILLVGESHIVFFKSWEASPVYEQVMWPTKLLFQGQRAVYINSYELIQVNFTYLPETVVCSSQYYTTGHYRLLAYGSAKCNATYLQIQKVSIDTQQEDTCEYERRVNIEIWEPRKIFWTYILVGGAILLVSVLGFFSWCCIQNFRLKWEYNDLVEVQYSQNEMENGPTESGLDSKTL